MISENKNGWGGRRAGAGRPSSDKRKRTFYITEQEYQFLRQQLEKWRTSSTASAGVSAD